MCSCKNRSVACGHYNLYTDVCGSVRHSPRNCSCNVGVHSLSEIMCCEPPWRTLLASIDICSNSWFASLCISILDLSTIGDLLTKYKQNSFALKGVYQTLSHISQSDSAQTVHSDLHLSHMTGMLMPQVDSFFTTQYKMPQLQGHIS